MHVTAKMLSTFRLSADVREELRRQAEVEERSQAKILELALRCYIADFKRRQEILKAAE